MLMFLSVVLSSLSFCFCDRSFSFLLFSLCLVISGSEMPFSRWTTACKAEKKNIFPFAFLFLLLYTRSHRPRAFFSSFFPLFYIDMCIYEGFFVFLVEMAWPSLDDESILLLLLPRRTFFFVCVCIVGRYSLHRCELSESNMCWTK